MHRRRPSPSLRLAQLVLLALALQSAGIISSRAAEPVTMVASGLANPRGFIAISDTDFLVAVTGPPGPTAGVVHVANGCPTAAVEGLPAYRIVFDGMTGVADVATLGDYRYLLLSGGDIDRGNTPNGLYRFDDAGKLTLIADISHFVRDHPVTNLPGDFDSDGQPYALLPMGDSFWVTEGNSNQLLRLGLDGTVSRVADLSAGHPIPTGIAPAPGGGAYVGFLTSTPYREGAAKVVLIAPDGTISEFWSGRTLVTALAVGPGGALYALEMATGIDEADPSSIVPGTGKVVRRTGATSAEDVVTGLNLPVAMEFGPDGALYIAGPAFGADQGEGTILRIDLADGTPLAVPSPMESTANCP